MRFPLKRFLPSLIGFLLLTCPVFSTYAADINLRPMAVLAMEAKQWDQLQRLLMSGTDPNTRDAGKQTLLIIAARYNYIRAVDILLEARAWVDLVDAVGNTALIWAANQGNTDIVKKLLAAKANPNIQNRQGMTALMYAGQNGLPTIAQTLISAGANPSLTDFTGRNASDWAQEGRNGETIRIIEAALKNP